MNVKMHKRHDLFITWTPPKRHQIPLSIAAHLASNTGYWLAVFRTVFFAGCLTLNFADLMILFLNL